MENRSDLRRYVRWGYEIVKGLAEDLIYLFKISMDFCICGAVGFKSPDCFCNRLCEKVLPKDNFSGFIP